MSEVYSEPCQNTPSLMFDRVLNMPLLETVTFLELLGEVYTQIFLGVTEKPPGIKVKENGMVAIDII